MEKRVKYCQKISRGLLLVFFLLSSLWISAQTDQEIHQLPIPEIGKAIDSSVYIIRSVHFIIKGITIERLLREKVDIAKGTSFLDLDSFERFLGERRQRLVNERVLADVEATYFTEPIDSEHYYIDIVFRVTDSWNTIALPYFRYDTNDGFTVSIRARDYNFIGSMQALVLNLDYSIDTLQRQSYGGYTSFGIPFRLLGHDAGINASQTLLIHADGRPTTSISNLSGYMVFNNLGFPITFQAAQGLQFNPDQYPDDPDPYFLVESASLSASMPTGLIAGMFGSISYSPSVTASLNWRSSEVLRADRKGLKFTFSHGLSFGRIDWIKNMRAGLSANLTNTDSYNIGTEVATIDIDASVEYHWTSSGKLGINALARGFYSVTDTPRTLLGAYMRGIINTRLWGTSAAFLNLDMPIKLFDFPTHVLIGKNWFDFELQMSPFLDLGYCGGGPGTTLSDKLWYSGGLEFLVYPLRMRTFIVRASAEFDLDSVVRNKSLTAPSPRDGASPYEIFFGLGLFY